MNQQILIILKQLISYKSITPKGLDALDYIADRLQKLGFFCLIKDFGIGEEKVWNLYAVYGNQKPNICFAGHVDVVPALRNELWDHDPYEMHIVEDKVYGRGTVDMKGAIACALAATEDYLKCNKPNGAISFLLTTDEEGDAKYGTKRMLEHISSLGYKIDFCILGEPTTKTKIGDTAKIGRRGSINFNLTINGKQGHVAYPEKAENPLSIMIDILKEIKEMRLDEGSEFFQSSNLEITSIDTNNKVCNVIPESVHAKFNIRFNDNHTAKKLNAAMLKIIDQYSNNYDLKYKSSSKPFIQKLSKNIQDFADIIESECKIKTSIETSGGTSDARFIHKYTEVLEFGLNCNLAHKINEYTKFSDLQTLYNVYYKSLIKFL